MAVAVIHIFEIIDIDNPQRPDLIAVLPERGKFGKCHGKGTAIGYARKLIGIGNIFEPLLDHQGVIQLATHSRHSISDDNAGRHYFRQYSDVKPEIKNRQIVDPAKSADNPAYCNKSCARQAHH